jgi:acyl carrier protein
MPDTTARVEAILRSILSDLLGLSPMQVAAMDGDTELFGALPELDSMAVAGLLTEMEDKLDIIIDDEDVDADLFETFGSLTQFAKAKVEG